MLDVLPPHSDGACAGLLQASRPKPSTLPQADSEMFRPGYANLPALNRLTERQCVYIYNMHFDPFHSLFSASQSVKDIFKLEFASKVHKHVDVVTCLTLFLLFSSFLAFSFSCHSFPPFIFLLVLSSLQQEWNKERIAQMKKQLQRHPGDTGSTPVQSMPDCVCLSYLYTCLFSYLSSCV